MVIVCINGEAKFVTLERVSVSSVLSKINEKLFDIIFQFF